MGCPYEAREYPGEVRRAAADLRYVVQYLVYVRVAFRGASVHLKVGWSQGVSQRGAADTWVRLHLRLLVAYGGIEVDRPYVVGRARGECAGGERPLRCGASARYSIEVGYRDAIEGQERSYRGAREEL